MKIQNKLNECDYAFLVDVIEKSSKEGRTFEATLLHIRNMDVESLKTKEEKTAAEKIAEKVRFDVSNIELKAKIFDALRHHGKQLPKFKTSKKQMKFSEQLDETLTKKIKKLLLPQEFYEHLELKKGDFVSIELGFKKIKNESGDGWTPKAILSKEQK